MRTYSARYRFTMLLVLLIITIGIFAAGMKTAAAAGTTLSTGDIAFIGIDSDGDDDFAFVLLKDIAADTSLYITDKGWDDTSGFITVLGDGIWQWSTASALAKGTVIYIKTSNNGTTETGSLAATPGTVVRIENNGTVVSYAGDQLFLYQGTEAAPTLIAGIHWNVETDTTASNWDGVATSVTMSALPDQLTNGVNAIWVYGSGPTEYDNFKYDSSTMTGTPSELRAAICNLSNWLVDTTNTTSYTLTDFSAFTVIITNTAPTLSKNTGMTVNEGASATVTQAMLQVTDAEQAAGDLTYTLTAVPANGTLYKDATVMSLSGTHTFTQADIDSNLISYLHSGSETTSDSFKFTVSDGDGGSLSETTFAITVTPVNDAPAVSNVQVSGTVAFGQALTGSYTYSDAESDPEGTSAYQWYRADSTAGLNQAPISGAGGISYTLVEADIGKYVCFSVTPVAQAGLSPGTAVASGWTAQVQKADCETTTVETPVLDSKTTTSITITAVTGYEYTRLAEGGDVNTAVWQSPVLFGGLTSGTTYDIYQRVKETSTHKASAISAMLRETTDKVPDITTTTLPAGTTGQAYSQSLSATGTTPITWSLASGSLPTGLTLTGNTISGTPSVVGNYSFEIKAENIAGSDTQGVSIAVSDPAIPPSITTASLPYGTMGQLYSQTLQATGTAPITWSLQSGSTPTGTTLSAAGVLSGTPSTPGAFNFTIKAENTEGSDTKALTVIIAVPTYIATLTPSTKTYPSAIETYGTQTAQEFTLANTGTGQLTGLSAQIYTGSSSFEISVSLASASVSPEGSTTVSVRPVTGLTPGTYTGSLRVTGDNSLLVSTALSFTVNEMPTYIISAAPDPVDFGSLASKYLPVAQKTVVVTNVGNQNITLQQPSAVYYTVGTLSASSLTPGSTASFTVAPRDGLAVGSWNETILITGNNGANAQTEARFTCTTPTVFGLLSGGNNAFYLGASAGISFTIDRPLASFTGLVVDGVVIGSGYYDLAAGSTIVTPHRDFLETLRPGVRTLRFQFVDGYSETNLTIIGTMPKTGDSHPLLFIILLIVLSTGTAWLLLEKWKRR